MTAASDQALIEYYHHASIFGFKLMYRDSEGIWDGIRWDGEHPSFFALRQTEEGRALDKLRCKIKHWNFGQSRHISLSLDDFLDEKDAAGYKFFAGKSPGSWVSRKSLGKHSSGFAPKRWMTCL
jgi:hypothetical protein